MKPNTAKINRIVKALPRLATPAAKSTPRTRVSPSANLAVLAGERLATNLADFADLQSRIDAINKSQALIEYNLDGTVITANENFLRILGYSLEEISGQHHAKFLDPGVSESADHKRIWQELATGRAYAGESRLLRKDGQAAWVHTTFQPVLNAAHQACKIIAVVVDVTAKQALVAEMVDLKVRADIMNQTSIVSESDLKGDILNINEKFIEISQ